MLLAGEGLGAAEVAARVGKSVSPCAAGAAAMRRRRGGLLKDATRPPGRKPLTAAKIKRVWT